MCLAEARVNQCTWQSSAAVVSEGSQPALTINASMLWMKAYVSVGMQSRSIANTITSIQSAQLPLHLPPGFVQRKWVWLLVFAPLWGPLFVNYGIGPVVSRTSDIAPVLGNCAGFVVAAALPYLDKVMAPPPQQGERM